MRCVIVAVAAAGILMTPAQVSVAAGKGKHPPKHGPALPFNNVDSYRALKVATEPFGRARTEECDTLWSAMPVEDKARTTRLAFSERCYGAPRSGTAR